MYSFYKHGPLARTVLGQNLVQGIDYAYTIKGWLKGINSTGVGDGSFDMGQDGKTGSINSNIASDVFGRSLNYFNQDYKAINNNVAPFANINVSNDLFNGNIKAQVVNIPKLDEPLVYSYKYDQLNRLTKMDAYSGLNNATNIFTAVSTDNYKERISYDANGNIQTYLRNNEIAAAKNNYSYAYTPGTNKLSSITNSVNSQTNTYNYDPIGNTTEDAMHGITNAVWNVYGKLQSCTNKDSVNISYSYSVDGQRISKKVGNVEEWYVRDATGNVMIAYTKDAAINSGHVSTKEYYKYGSSLLSIKNHTLDVQVPESEEVQTFVSGKDAYILTDHLGNTRAIVSDKKLQMKIL